MAEKIALDANDYKIASQIAKACMTDVDPESTVKSVIRAVLGHAWVDEELRPALICDMAGAAGLEVLPEGADEDGDEDGADDVVGDPWRDRDD